MHPNFREMQIPVLHQCYQLAWYPNKITFLQAFHYWTWIFYYCCFLYIKLTLSKSYVSFPGLEVLVPLQHIKVVLFCTKIVQCKEMRGGSSPSGRWSLEVEKKMCRLMLLNFFEFKWDPAVWDPQHSCSLTVHSMYTFNPLIFVFFTCWGLRS